MGYPDRVIQRVSNPNFRATLEFVEDPSTSDPNNCQQPFHKNHNETLDLSSTRMFAHKRKITPKSDEESDSGAHEVPLSLTTKLISLLIGNPVELMDLSKR